MQHRERHPFERARQRLARQAQHFAEVDPTRFEQ